jgi:hypothetical protein
MNKLTNLALMRRCRIGRLLYRCWLSESKPAHRLDKQRVQPELLPSVNFILTQNEVVILVLIHIVIIIWHVWNKTVSSSQLMKSILQQ